MKFKVVFLGLFSNKLYSISTYLKYIPQEDKKKVEAFFNETDGELNKMEHEFIYNGKTYIFEITLFSSSTKNHIKTGIIKDITKQKKESYYFLHNLLVNSFKEFTISSLLSEV